MADASAEGAQEGVSGTLSQAQVISYALPVITFNMLMIPMSIIQGIYAKHYGIALSTLALIVFASRIFDAVSDPMIGYLSDRYRRRYGTRKPFIVAGGVLLLIAGFYLYVPPPQVTTTYVAGWFIAFYMAYTLFEIPHITWPCDVAKASTDRARLYSYRVVAFYCGMVLFYSIPLLPVFPTQDITPQTLKVAFFVSAALALPFLFQSMRSVPSGTPPVPFEEAPAQSRVVLLWALFKEIRSNKPMLIFSAAFFLGGIASGMWYGLIYIYVDAYLGMGDQFAKMFLAAFVIGIIITPIWYRLVIKFGKKSAFSASIMVIVVSYLYTGFLNPGQTSFATLLLLKVLNTTAIVGSLSVAPAMLADIADYAQWKTGVERNATYFSIKVFFEKSSIALGAALALAIAGWSGFVVTDAHFSPESIWGLKLAIVWGPVLFGSLSILFALLTPINERRHRIIKRRLDSRLKRALAPSSNPGSIKSSDPNQQETAFNAN